MKIIGRLRTGRVTHIAIGLLLAIIMVMFFIRISSERANRHAYQAMKTVLGDISKESFEVNSIKVTVESLSPRDNDLEYARRHLLIGLNYQTKAKKAYNKGDWQEGGLADSRAEGEYLDARRAFERYEKRNK